MKAYLASQDTQQPDLWHQAVLPDPEVGPGQVLIKVRATSLNYRDLMIAKGRYGSPNAKELIPLSDGAGEIVAVGAGVTQWKIDDRVCGSFFTNWKSGIFLAEYHCAALGGSTNGMLAEYVVLPAHGVVRVPSHLSFEEAATLPCAAVTAWHALMEAGPKLTPGSTILTLGTGGVSIFALQFAKAAGFEVISTTSSDTKSKKLFSLGARDVINYRDHPDWESKVAQLTNDLGVDHVVEVGGAGTLPKSMSAVRFGGTISLIGILTGTDGQVNPMPLLHKSIRTLGIYVGSAAMFDSMNATIEALKIRPVIEKVYEFNDAATALNDLQLAAHFGKIVIRVC